MNTNNLKIVSKDYLAEQFYNYHEQYVLTMQKELDEGKQKAITVVSPEVSLEDGKMTFNVGGKKTIGCYLKYNDNEQLVAQPPIENVHSEIGDNLTLVSKKAILNFEGTNKITKVGTIAEGTWEVGSIKIDENTISVGSSIIGIDDNNKASINKITIDEASINKIINDEASIKNATINNAFINDITVLRDVKTNKILVKEIEYKRDNQDDIEEINVSSNIKIKKDFIFESEGNFQIKEDLLKLALDNNNKIIVIKRPIIKKGNSYYDLKFSGYNSIFDEGFINELDN